MALSGLKCVSLYTNVLEERSFFAPGCKSTIASLGEGWVEEISLDPSLLLDEGFAKLLSDHFARNNETFWLLSVKFWKLYLQLLLLGSVHVVCRVYFLSCILHIIDLSIPSCLNVWSTVMQIYQALFISDISVKICKDKRTGTSLTSLLITACMRRRSMIVT